MALNAPPVCRRYARQVKGLRKIFSEYGLIRFRVAVEARWLQQLSQIPDVTEVAEFSPDANAILEQLATNFTVENAQAVKKVPFQFNTQSTIYNSNLLAKLTAEPRIHARQMTMPMT